MLEVKHKQKFRDFRRRKRQQMAVLYIFFAAITLSVYQDCQSLHIEGEFQTADFFLFLSKFGFQKTEFLNNNLTHGYIYGNVTDLVDKGQPLFLSTSSTAATTTLSPGSSTRPTPKAPTWTSPIPPLISANPSLPSSSIESRTETSISSSTPSTSSKAQPKRKRSASSNPYPATLVAVDRSYFLDFYRLRNSKEDPNTICRLMFEEISNGNGCSPEAKSNFDKYLRRVPCSKNGVCADEANSTSLVKGSQLTFPIINKNEAKWGLFYIFDEWKPPVLRLLKKWAGKP